jgi:pimeloyl-ACP methyl ester carboxylesterase
MIPDNKRCLQDSNDSRGEIMNLLQWIAKACVGIVITLSMIFGGAVWYYRDIPAEVLEAKYAGQESKFINIDGVRFHYRDEGPRDAPTILLIHAHWASLIMWDEWANALKDKYRVVRFDMAGHGLTGIDPTGDYTLERGVKLLEAFNNTLGLDQFDLVGTSLGGTHAIHFSIKNPNQVNRLVLLNPGALNAGVRGRDTARALPWWIDIMTIITPRQFFQFMLEGGYGDPRNVSDTIVSRWHDMQMSDGHRPAEIARTRQYVSGDIVGMIKSLSIPTLVMWGKENPVVTVDQAYEFIGLLENAPDKQLVVYPGLGHMAVLEDPDQRTAHDIRAYLDGAKSFYDYKDAGS